MYLGGVRKDEESEKWRRLRSFDGYGDLMGYSGDVVNKACQDFPVGINTVARTVHLS